MLLSLTAVALLDGVDVVAGADDDSMSEDEDEDAGARARGQQRSLPVSIPVAARTPDRPPRAQTKRRLGVDESRFTLEGGFSLSPLSLDERRHKVPLARRV